MAWSIGAGLEDRGVVVTGAAGGIGRAVTQAFASAGARVCAVDLDPSQVDAVVAALPDPARHLAVGMDLLRLDEHERLLQRVRETFGRFDVLAHLAAILLRRPDLDAITEEDWDCQLDVNLKVTFFLNRAAARLFRAQGRGGRIINFTSQAWQTGGFGGSIVYAASKGGVVSLSRGLARTLAPDGITVNTVAPGAADTPMLYGMPPESLAAFIQQIPLGRPASPEEIAGAVVFLASDHARYITGATLNLTGGQLMY